MFIDYLCKKVDTRLIILFHFILIYFLICVISNGYNTCITIILHNIC